MKKFAVIVAGGTGTRMGGAEPKQFMLLRDKPVLYYAIRPFFRLFEIRSSWFFPRSTWKRASPSLIRISGKDIQLTTGGYPISVGQKWPGPG